MIIPNQEEFQSYMREFSSPCGNPECEISYLLRFWSENKKWLRPYFPESLIFTTPVDHQPNLNLPMSKLYKKWFAEIDAMNQLISSPDWLLRSTDLAEYNRQLDERNYWSQLFSISALLDNRAPFTYTFSNGIKVQKGQKLMRVLKEIAKLANITNFELFRQEHSMVLQTKKVRADLCLSIHPLDYITMSDTTTWSSCMNWMCGGEYRIGTIEMMNSPYVVVAYLRSPDKKISWSNHTWNSKTWRCLLIADPETKAITSVKSYPYYSSDLIQMAEKQLASLLQWQGEPRQLERYEYNFNTDNMYNDFWSTTHWMLGKVPSTYCINYSGPAECMICGRELFDVQEGQETFTSCRAEDDPCYCSDCGDRVPYDDVCYDYWRDPVCPYCIEDHYLWDRFSDSYIHQEDCYEVTVGNTLTIISPSTRFWNYYVNIGQPRYDEATATYYLLPEDLTPHGQEFFKGAF